MMHTIDSDEEIEPEVVSGDEESEEEVGSRATRTATSGKRGAKKTTSSTNSDKKRKAFELDFDDGMFYSNRGRRDVDAESRDDLNENDDDDVDGDDDDDDDDDDEDEDEDIGDVSNFDVEVDAEGNIRNMPRAEERALRAMGKAARKARGDESGDADDDINGMTAEQERSYFDSVTDSSNPDGIMFSQLNLSRPLLRAIEAAGYVTPTPVQAKVIPLALAGRDVCASAVTGSGKTAAFVLPFLERLLYKPRDSGAIRVLVVTPTRELANQIFDVLQKLARFTSVTCCLVCGGKKDLKSQAAALRMRPDVVVGTPGRIIDHLRNSATVSVDELDVLILDEVDRLLDLGFQAEIEELVRHCPESRQTLLFSATMTTRVEDLVRLSLKRPVRVKTEGGSTTVAPRLVQEFVRVRREEEREAMMAALVVRVFRDRCIVFFEMKKDAHRFFAVLCLLGVKAAELHGDLPQVQRDLALQRFRDVEVNVLVATDVAARGLDIPGVRFVVNAEMPRSASTYIHRVGRTARAGAQGTAATFVGDARRRVLKEVLKGDGGALSGGAGGRVLTRTIPPAVITKFIAQIASVESRISEILAEERLRGNIDAAERDANKAQNILEHEEEISARPARTWYQSERDKVAIKEAGKQRAREEALEASLGRAAVKEQAQSAQERALALARKDDYRREEKEQEKEHRLSRKKRRRLEALREGGPRDKEAESKARDADSRLVHSASRRAKASSRQEEEERKDRALLDVRLGGETRANHKNNQGKLARHKFAAGGLDLDGDAHLWGGSGATGVKTSSKERKRAAQEKEFTDFDPNKRLRKGGKDSHKGFKSKSKFKRR